MSTWTGPRNNLKAALATEFTNITSCRNLMMYQLTKSLKVPISPDLHQMITSGTYPNIGHFQQVIPCPSLQLARCRPTYGRLGSKSGVASHQLPRHLELMYIINPATALRWSLSGTLLTRRNPHCTSHHDWRPTVRARVRAGPRGQLRRNDDSLVTGVPQF